MRIIFRSRIHQSSAHERRADVDRQEPDARRDGAPDGSVERPRRRVHRERERVDVRVRDEASSAVGAPVGVVRDREEEPQVRARDGDDDPVPEHVLASPRRRRPPRAGGLASHVAVVRIGQPEDQAAAPAMTAAHATKRYR